MARDIHVVILAAGQGKRMHSSLPKVIHPVLFRPMVHYTVDVAKSLNASSLSMIVGHGENMVREACAKLEGVQFFRQAEQLGTGHAVRMAEPFLKGKHGYCLVLNGDVPLLTPQTVKAMVDKAEATQSEAVLVTAKVGEPRGYGRILRHSDGSFRAIQEDADCSEAEKKVDEINAGVYCFRLESFLTNLSRLKPANKQGEYYLTDVVGDLVSQKKKVDTVTVGDPKEVGGINDRHQLFQAESFLQEKVNKEYQLRGVTILSPANTYIDPRCQIEKDVTIEPGCILINSTIAAGAVLEANCRIQDSKIGSQTRIKQGSYIEESVIGSQCAVGPYAHLRPGSVLKNDVKIGNFVEVKKATFHEGSKASHLSYIGDAEIGKASNLGCGFITCNYDGHKKHQTIIGDHVFIGSDSQTVAPVKIDSGSYIASGTTVTQNVPADSLVISRGKQITKPGYAKRYQKEEKK